MMLLRKEKGEIMLYITLGEKEGMVRDTKVYFDYNYEEEWLDDDLVKEMVLDVDKSTVISHNHIVSPVLGDITPKDLSGGVKTLILMLKEPDLITYASNCGNNCSKWILKVAALQDVHIALGYIMDFGNSGDIMNAIIENDGTVIKTVEDFDFKAIEML